MEDAFRCEEETHLTVMKTSLFFPGDGFAAYDSKGELAFRVDSYGPDARDTGEVVLMDAHGRCLLTVRRKVITNFLSGALQLIRVLLEMFVLSSRIDLVSEISWDLVNEKGHHQSGHILIGKGQISGGDS